MTTMTGLDFAGLAKRTTSVLKQTTNTIPEWPDDKPLDPQFHMWIEAALAEPDKRQLIPLDSYPVDKRKAVAVQLHSGLRTALRKAAPDKELHTRPTYDDTPEKNMIEFGFSVGAKRGKKTTA